MIQLNAEQIRDFRGCRYLYKAKHIDKIAQKHYVNERDLLPSQFEDAIKKTIKYFYFEAMNKNIVSYKDLQKKFERLWLKEKTVKDIINDENTPQKNVHHFTTEGIKIVYDFYKVNHKNPGEVLLLSEEYSVPITKNVIINGNIDIALNRNGKVTLPVYTTKGKTYFSEGNEGYYKIVLDAIAFKYKTDLDINNVSIISFKGGGYKQDDIVIDMLKVRQLKEVVEEIYECKRFLPNHDYYWCKNCSMEKYCSTW